VDELSVAENVGLCAPLIHNPLQPFHYPLTVNNPILSLYNHNINKNPANNTVCVAAGYIIAY